MIIKCPDCGIENSYGRNLCHVCNENKFFFGAIFNEPRKAYKWNCDYVDDSDGQCTDKWIAYWPKTTQADDIGSFYYSGFQGATNNWRGFTD